MSGTNNDDHLHRLSPHEHECLDTFLQYYNTTHQKRFQAIRKLDVGDPTRKMPDVLCSDGNLHLLVEITRVFIKDDQQKWDTGYCDITDEVRSHLQGKISGYFGVVDMKYPIHWQGGQKGKHRLITEISKTIHAYANNMAVGESVSVDQPMSFKLIRLSDTGSKITIISKFEHGCSNTQHIHERFLPIVKEASEKFANAKVEYPHAHTILLVENRDWVLADIGDRELNDIAQVLKTTDIDHLYLLKNGRIEEVPKV